MSDYENDGNYFDVWSYVARLGCRVRPSSDPFFADGDTICQVNKVFYISAISFRMANTTIAFNYLKITNLDFIDANLPISNSRRRRRIIAY